MIMDEHEITELKIKINQFIWEHAPGEMMLEEAEKASIALLEAMVPEANLTDFLTTNVCSAFACCARVAPFALPHASRAFTATPSEGLPT